MNSTAPRTRFATALLPLGLACATLLGGSLRIDSSPGKGTTVNFEIPLEGVTHDG